MCFFPFFDTQIFEEDFFSALDCFPHFLFLLVNPSKYGLQDIGISGSSDILSDFQLFIGYFDKKALYRFLRDIGIQICLHFIRR